MAWAKVHIYMGINDVALYCIILYYNRTYIHMQLQLQPLDIHSLDMYINIFIILANNYLLSFFVDNMDRSNY
jgi:cyanate permease